MHVEEETDCSPGQNRDSIRLQCLMTKAREIVLASAHHLVLGAAVCDHAEFPESAQQMRDMIDRLRLLADQLDEAAKPREEGAPD